MPPPPPKDRYPAGASPEYITARASLLEAELALHNQVEAVAAQRRALPAGALMSKTYTFIDAASGEETTLADLAKLQAIGHGTSNGSSNGPSRSLVLFHIMFGPDMDEPCPLCGSFIDGLNGVAQHLAQKVTFVVVAKASAAQLSDYAARRGWRDVRLLSSGLSDFNGDMGVEEPLYSPSAEQMEGVSVFAWDAAEAKVRHVYTASARFDAHTYRGLDLLGPLWSVLDLVPEGRGETWFPDNDYIDMARNK